MTPLHAIAMTMTHGFRRRHKSPTTTTWAVGALLIFVFLCTWGGLGKNENQIAWTESGPCAVTEPALHGQLSTAHWHKAAQKGFSIPSDSHRQPKPHYDPLPIPADQVVVDNFPRALVAHSAADLPPLNPRSQPKKRPGVEKTPLFIGFTRNWRMLQQCVVSYLTAGWPADQIYIFDNSGTMLSNVNGRLSLQNPFFLNHTRLEMLGVNIIVTPTLLTFSQLQNYFLWTALTNKMPYYFWGHMDTLVTSFEGEYVDSLGNITSGDFRSLYDRVLDVLEDVQEEERLGLDKPWGAVFFHYDWMSLVNTKAYDAVGGWDTHIPSYIGDWDFYFRLTESGFPTREEKVGYVFDAEMLDDVEIFYRKKGGPKPRSKRHQELLDARNPVNPDNSAEFSTDAQTTASDPDDEDSREVKYWEDDGVDSEAYRTLHDFLEGLQSMRDSDWDIRQSWQTRQVGGKGEPYFRHPVGFQKGLEANIRVGYDVYRAKWGNPTSLESETGLMWSIDRELERAWEYDQNAL